MLPANHRLRAARDFSLTTRSGTKRSRGCVVVSGMRVADDPRPARVGLAIGRSVGNSVTRHAVARRIRGALAGVVEELPAGSLWVIRGLPGAGQSPTLIEDLHEAMAAVRSAWS